MTGWIFDIQSYAIHDGPGIRSCVFFKGCPLRCAWCHNPESQRRQVQLAFDRDRCSACGRCLSACRSGARRRAGAGIVLDRARCTACGACAEVCLSGASERIGRPVSAAAIVEKILLDRPFFDASGGGVTLSGGEPTHQPAFLLELLGLLRDEGIHTAVETCGAFPADLIPELAAGADLFLFDLKHMSEEEHRAATGRGNADILHNFAALLEQLGPKRVQPRLPIIPGFNATPGSVAAICDFLTTRDYRGPVQLLPYHRWAGQKYARLDRPTETRPDLDEESRACIDDTISRFGLRAEWN